MIGLKRNTVKVVPYQRAWSVLYDRTKRELEELLGQKIHAIAHVGSTAIVGMSAKPIIDIAVAIVEENSLTTIRPILRGHHYEDRGERNGGYLFVKREKERTTHHIHIVLASDKVWRNLLAFRNKLNTDEDTRKQYLALKMKLAEQHQNDRGAYTAAKHGFIQEVLLQIEEEKQHN